MRYSEKSEEGSKVTFVSLPLSHGVIVESPWIPVLVYYVLWSISIQKIIFWNLMNIYKLEKPL